MVDCEIGDCWTSRIEKNGKVLFNRKCSNETCKNPYRNECCQTTEGDKECKKMLFKG